MKTPFEVLGVDETAGDEAIKRAYLQKVRSTPERDPERFQAIRAASRRWRTIGVGSGISSSIASCRTSRCCWNPRQGSARGDVPRSLCCCRSWPPAYAKR
jgi:hypothetical protein